MDDTTRSLLINKCNLFTDTVRKHWQNKFKVSGQESADLWLDTFSKQYDIGKTGLYIDASDEDIFNYSKLKTEKIFELIKIIEKRGNKHNSLKGTIYNLHSIIVNLGLTFPLNERYWYDNINEKKVRSTISQITDPMWFARQLRTIAIRQLDQMQRELFLVHRDKSKYISNISFNKYLSRKEKNRNLLEKTFAQNDLGDIYSLAELSDKNVSNPTLRRHELMTRMDGFEKWADENEFNWQPVFYTITAPSKYHPTSQSKGHISPNQKYNGTTPKQAQHYLNTLWQRIRAELNRQGIKIFGFRVAEPHHDGTPHWHLLLFTLEHQETELTEIIRNYAFAEDGDEKGANKHRFEAVRIDKEKGRATGYIAKYVSKNIDGYKVDIDDETKTSSAISALRAVAWAGVWGIRQFQQIGGSPVTVYRELRRLNTIEVESQLNDKTDHSDIYQLYQAANDGEWHTYTQLMGGATCKRKNLLLRAYYFINPNAGRYGNDVSKLKGIAIKKKTKIVTRLRQWIINPTHSDSYIFKPRFEAPWSSVNNCTKLQLE